MKSKIIFYKINGFAVTKNLKEHKEIMHILYTM